MSLLSREITALPSSERDALGGEMPHAKAMQYNTELSMHFQPVGQSKALLLSSWQSSSVVCLPQEVSCRLHVRLTAWHPLSAPGGDASCQRLKAWLEESSRHQA